MKDIEKFATKMNFRNSDKGLMPITRILLKKHYPGNWKYPKPPQHLPEYKLFGKK